MFYCSILFLSFDLCGSGSDLINALTQDTVVSPDALTFDALGIVPHKLKGYPIEFLLSYRKGGPQYGSTMGERCCGYG
ncbi:hypothetical protein LOK49_LG11G00909 [Camellia lanceoleosa]|uniref:Uncharacterized protein n=1 Tax=Camellia lanceoleosa TaxID=1840588 RepID=A0ACC0G1K0_9ERIC|nr:hypothetical protein LOK49_LG11G00909 [Camellia lanceoleosa]